MVSTAVSFSNGCRFESISYSIAPNEKMSERRSTVAPRACSGDMNATVPTTMPGAVSFEEVRNGGDTTCAIETMFIQRSARFRAMGIRDTFVRDRLIGFYHDLAKPDSGVDVRLHILRLDGEIVAVRYNVVHNDRMFCLISSMSDDPAIQHGSPGKQCLFRVMQTVFDEGIRVFDMGSGFTDEKRHWCNRQVPLRQHYFGLTPQGAVIVKAHRLFQKARATVKANPQLKAAIRSLHQLLDRARPAPAGKSE